MLKVTTALPSERLSVFIIDLLTYLQLLRVAENTFTSLIRLS